MVVLVFRWLVSGGREVVLYVDSGYFVEGVLVFVDVVGLRGIRVGSWIVLLS